MSGQATVRLEDVSLGYRGPDGPRVVQGVSCTARAGHITVLMGPNASGKTSVLRALAGHLVPLSGRIEVLGQSPHRLGGSALAERIAYVPQRGTVSAPLRVHEVVEMGRFALAPDGARAARAIEAVGLAGESNQIFDELSAGQQQRALFARALAQLEPGSVLLLDEPTSALDLPSAARTLALLRTLAGDGATIVLALHDLLQAQRVADDVWFFAGGRLHSAAHAAHALRPQTLSEVFSVRFVEAQVPGEPPLLLPARESP